MATIVERYVLPHNMHASHPFSAFFFFSRKLLYCVHQGRKPKKKIEICMHLINTIFLFNNIQTVCTRVESGGKVEGGGK